MKIINGGLIERKPTYIGLIFGQPGSGKSTLAAGATRPILLDLDLGVQRVATKDRAGMDVVRIETYDDLMETINAPELKNYDTLIVDTFGAIIDLMIRDKFKGSLNPKTWGVLKTDFMYIVNELRKTGKSVLFLAHESEEKNDDKIIKRPQCQGKAKDELMKVLDFIGYLHNGTGGVRILEFGEDDSFYAKNTYGFKAKYTLPDVKLGDNNFWKDTIETRICEFLIEQEKSDSELLQKMREMTAKIAELKSPDDFEQFAESLSTTDLTGGAVVKLKRDLLEHGKTIGVKFDVESKKWTKGE